MAIAGNNQNSSLKNNSFSSPLEILHVNSKKVSCDGSRDDKSHAAGHPMVYLDMGKNDFVICPYCSKYFTLQKSHPVMLKKISKHNV